MEKQIDFEQMVIVNNFSHLEKNNENQLPIAFLICLTEGLVQ